MKTYGQTQHTNILTFENVGVGEFSSRVSLWLRDIIRRYDWQCVLLPALSLSLSTSVKVSFRWQSTLLIPQCPGINADNMQPFEGCVLLYLKCMLSSGSWQQHTCSWGWISSTVRLGSADPAAWELTDTVHWHTVIIHRGGKNKSEKTK